MPPKRRNNKKKKGASGHGKNKKTSSKKGPVPSGGEPSSQVVDPTANLKGSPPEHWNEPDQACSLEQSCPTICSRHKNAANHFANHMTDECPVVGGKEKRSHSVQSLAVAADWMVEMNHLMDPLILKDLKLAIRVRSRVAKSVFGGGDAGHKHFLSVSVCCWTISRSLPKKDVPSAGSRETVKEQQEQAQQNHHAALFDDVDEDEADDDEEIFPSAPPPHPKPEPDTDLLTLDELLNSDACNDAAIFLMTVDELMSTLSAQHKSILPTHQFHMRAGALDASIVEKLLEAAVAANMAMQQVQQLEMDLMSQHKHFATPCRLLAAMVLPELTQKLTRTIRERWW